MSLERQATRPKLTSRICNVQWAFPSGLLGRHVRLPYIRIYLLPTQLVLNSATSVGALLKGLSAGLPGARFPAFPGAKAAGARLPSPEPPDRR